MQSFRGVIQLKLNEAISKRVVQLLQENSMTPYQLYKKSGVPKSTIGSIINCTNASVTMRIIHEICQGFEIEIAAFFASPFFDENNLEP